MTKVGFYLEDVGFSAVDCSEPELGNPGIGGTPYCFVAVAKALFSIGMSPAILHQDCTNRMPAGLETFIVPTGPGGLGDAIKQAGVQTLVVRAGSAKAMANILDAIPHVSIIAWAHNHLTWHDLQFLGTHKRIKKVVFVGDEQRALANDTACRDKGITIQNPFSLPITTTNTKKRLNSAVYVGSLIPSKGFHRLAKIWPQVRKQVPNARLEVIGSGALYNRNAQLGPLGVADSAYERLILKYLRGIPDEYGVTFHGLLARERFDLMAQCCVGLPNPTGLTECFPGSVLEMSACGLPIATMRRWGACDTVVDGKTGILVDKESWLIRAILNLMQDSDLANRLGEQGQNWVGQQFTFDKIANKWRELFLSLGDSGHQVSGGNPSVEIRGNYWWKSVYDFNGKRNKVLGGMRTICTKVDSWRLKR